MACLFLIILEGGKLKATILNEGNNTEAEENHIRWALKAFDVEEDKSIKKKMKKTLYEMDCCITNYQGVITLTSDTPFRNVKRIMQDKMGYLVANMDREFLFYYIQAKDFEISYSTENKLVLEISENEMQLLIDRFSVLLEENKYAFVCNHNCTTLPTFVDSLFKKIRRKLGISELRKLFERQDAEYGKSILFWSALRDNSLFLKKVQHSNFHLSKKQREVYFASCFQQSCSDLKRVLSDFKPPTRRLKIPQATMKVIISMLDIGVSLEWPLPEHYSAIDIASLVGSSSVLNKLLDTEDFQSKTKHNCLFYACLGSTNNYTSVMKMILERTNIKTITVDQEGRILLHYACQGGNLNTVVELLLQDKSNIDEKDLDGCTALHFAAQNGHKDVVELLLQNKANIHEKDVYDRTAFHFAAVNGHKDVVELLLQNKANIDEKDVYGRTGLHFAAVNGHKDVVELLLQYTANIHEQDKNGHTALHLAAENGHKDVVELLLQYTANIHEKDKNGHTALHLAAENGHKDVVELLLQYKANIDEKDEDGHTALHWAAENRHKDVVELLLQNKANIDEKDEDGRTALHWAADNRHKDVVELLLHNEANIDEKDADGHTALHWAEYQGRKDFVELLSVK